MQLAEKANISRNHIQRIETASCSCTLDTLIDIAEALNIPLKNYLNLKTKNKPVCSKIEQTGLKI